jgi:hypothetical protein
LEEWTASRIPVSRVWRFTDVGEADAAAWVTDGVGRVQAASRKEKRRVTAPEIGDFIDRSRVLDDGRCVKV